MSARRGILRDAFSERSQRRFKVAAVLAEVFSSDVELVSRRMLVRGPDVLDAIMTQLCSVAQGLAPTSEWNDVGMVLADEIRRRMSIRGDTGEEHHARRMV